MPDQQLLFSLLQFVALVAPAIAVLMQLLETRGESGSEAFRILEIGLTLMMIGGLIIGKELLDTINDPVVAIGSGLVFGSLILGLSAFRGGIYLSHSRSILQETHSRTFWPFSNYLHICSQ